MDVGINLRSARLGRPSSILAAATADEIAAMSRAKFYGGEEIFPESARSSRATNASVDR